MKKTKPKTAPKKKPNKQAELTAESLFKIAHGHMWFAKDALQAARRFPDSDPNRWFNTAIARMHRESANILRDEAKRVRKKP